MEVDGPWLLWVIISLILGNAFCHGFERREHVSDHQTLGSSTGCTGVKQMYAQGMHPPQNVTLACENFFLFVTWQPPLDFTNNTQYEVEERSLYSTSNSSSEWTKVTSCQEHETLRCDLLSDSHGLPFYQARVRAHDGARLSDWACSHSLQPYGNNIIGPLGVSLADTDDSLTVVISLPPPPDSNSSKAFQDIRNVSYEMTLTEEGLVLKSTPFNFTESTFKHTYGNLEYSTHYCVEAKAKFWLTKKSIQCIRMPDRPADRILIVMVSVFVIGLILLSIMAGAYFRRHTQSKPAFPKSLTLLNLEPNSHPPALNPVFCLEEDCIASVSAEVLVSETNTELQLIPRGCSAQVSSTYCARGFDASSRNSDFFSSGELDYHTGENYRSAAELMESSTHPSPSSARILPCDIGTSCISLNQKCEIDIKSRPIGLSSPSKTDIPFNSIKLQTMADILYSPETHLLRTESDMPQGTPTQQTIEPEKHHKPDGFPKCSDFQDDSSLELKDRKTVFSGYEFRQPIL